jgi:hypothetical protein
MSSENQEVAATEQAPTLSGDTNTPTQNTDWKASLSDEIRNEKSLENISDIESLAKSFVHAQKLVGADKIPVPNKFATDEDWNKVYEKLGRPNSAQEYNFNLPDGSSVDEKALTNFKDAAHKYGLLPKQAEGILNFYQDMTNGMIADLDSKAEQGRMNAEQTLQKEWGAAYNSKLNSAMDAAREYLDTDFAHLTLSDGTKVGDHPVFIKAFAKIASDVGEDKFVSANGPQYMTPDEIGKQVGELQKQGSAYWDKNHPNHDAAVKEVQNLLELKHKR